MAHLKKHNGHLLRVGVPMGGHLVLDCTTDPPLPTTCCEQGPVLTATFTGATGCAVGLNATFALTPFGSCQFVYDSGELSPIDPCGTACFTSVSTFGWTLYWQPARYAVTVTLSNVDQSVEVLGVVNYTLYRDVGPGCEISSGDNFPRKGALSYFRRSTCTSGALTRDGGAPSGIASGLPPSGCTIEF